MDEFNNNKKKRLKMILYSLDGQKEKKNYGMGNEWINR